MAIVRPFRAIRPVRDKVHLVATRPYYSYKPNVLKAKLEDNPFTLLHIINPEFNRLKRTEPNSSERFQLVKDGYNAFKEKGILIQDIEEHLYIYRQRCPDKTYIGVIGGADAEEYLSDHIKKHEATLTEREGVFTRYLEIVGLNAEPVLMAYSGTPKIKALIEEVIKNRPEYEFTTTDSITHELWLATPLESKEISAAFESVESVYIADGHHRSASSVALYEKYKAEGKTNLGRYFLSYFVEDSTLKILEFQRLVKHLNGLSESEFLTKISALGTLTPLNTPRKPNEAHEITLYLNNKGFSLQFDKAKIEIDHPTHALDSEILTQWILNPILGISDLKTSDDISFVPGNTPFINVINQVNEGSYQVAFFLYPIPMTAVKKVADHGLFMPPKSTWVEPKLRSGLTIYHINE